MIYISKAKVSDKVHYIPYNNTNPEDGLIKELVDNDHVRVVYRCADEWDNYMSYTGVLTQIDYLHEGWVNELPF